MQKCRARRLREPAPSRRFLFALLLTFAAALLSSCRRDEGVAPAPAADPAAVELAEARRNFNDSQDSLAAHQERLSATAAALRAANEELGEKEKAMIQFDLQLRAAATELQALKKSEALVFAEISRQQQQGQNVIALAGYRKFLSDHPRSPLASHAEKAIADLTDATARETQQRAERQDPTRPGRESRRLLEDGLLTLQELAPMLKNRTRAQVLALLGKPNRVFPDGTDIGYDNRVSSSSGVRKGMLIISFDASVVSALRMDYAGPKLTP